MENRLSGPTTPTSVAPNGTVIAVIHWRASSRASGAPDVAEQLRAVLDEPPSGRRMTADDVATCWSDRPIEYAPQCLHVLDPAAFRPASPARGQQVRELTEVDRDDFEQFLNQCSPNDREECDVDIGGEHELTVGMEVGDRIVAVASMFEWRGFSDLGVMTAPEFRPSGRRQAVVSALSERLLDGPRVVVYRYNLENLGSAGIARSLALTPLGVAESVRPGEGA